MMKNTIVLLLGMLFVAPAFGQSSWREDATWHDGLVEKATYEAEREVYGKQRSYEAIIFTNKEQHDTGSMTKAQTSDDTVEVFKHNHLEVIPTPNYDYKYAT